MAATAFTELNAARRPSARCSLRVTLPLVEDLAAHLVVLAADHLMPSGKIEAVVLFPLILNDAPIISHAVPLDALASNGIEAS